MGGEPTLHPQFVALVERARVAGLRLVVFSNGLMPAEALAYLASLPVAECTVLVNVNDPQTVAAGQHEQRLATIHRLGARALLGFTIYRPDFDLDFLLPILAEAGCRPALRLGLAQPCLSGRNQFVFPSQYVGIGARIARFADRAAQAGMRIELDCGFVRCMFSDQDLEVLQAAHADVGWRCSPILDVDLEGRVIHCYPLSGLGSLPLAGDDARSLRSAFEDLVWPYRHAGVFAECSLCPLKASGECPGGCLAVTMRRFRSTPFSLTVPRREADD